MSPKSDITKYNLYNRYPPHWLPQNKNQKRATCSTRNISARKKLKKYKYSFKYSIDLSENGKFILFIYIYIIYTLVYTYI